MSKRNKELRKHAGEHAEQTTAAEAAPQSIYPKRQWDTTVLVMASLASMVLGILIGVGIRPSSPPPPAPATAAPATTTIPAGGTDTGAPLTDRAPRTGGEPDAFGRLPGDPHYGHNHP